MDKVQKIREVIEKRYECWREKESNSHSIESEIRMSECQHLLLMLNSLQEEPVSEELEIAANEWDAKASFTPFYMALDDKGNPYEVKQDYTTHAESFKVGAKWQKEQIMKNTIDAHCFGFQGAALFSFRLPADNYLVGSEVKVIVIKED